MNIVPIFTIIVATLFLVPSIVSAAYSDMDEECKAFGYDFGVARWEWVEGFGFYEADHIQGFSTNVTGWRDEVSWQSNPAISGVVSNEECVYQVLNGGIKGGFSKHGDDYINHVTFCGDYGSEHEIPEFSALAASILLLAGLGILLYRRDLVLK